jgi:hypothetical protein
MPVKRIFKMTITNVSFSEFGILFLLSKFFESHFDFTKQAKPLI